MAGRVPRFWFKVAFALGLVVLADVLMLEHAPGLNLGIVSLALTAAVAATNPAIFRSRPGRWAIAAAAALATLQVERATLVGCLLFAVALGGAVLSPRAAGRDDAGRWARRLLMAALKAVPGPWFDLRTLLQARGRATPLRVSAVLLAAALPVVGGLVFLCLFAVANPLIAGALGGIAPPELEPGRVVFWAVAGFVAWTALRPRGLKVRPPGRRKPRDLGLPGVTPTSVAVSLVVFNLLFALQNGLDAAFLWSGVPLPAGMTLAEYAHRGAYPLIVTALLAGLFVLVFLRPGTPTAASRPIRVLVMGWVAQNLFLVASTILRTLTYIEAYSLTRMRIAALLWMALVALGLVLIAWRLAKGKSGGWLINANVLAAGVVLAFCSVVDLGAMAAAWNVRHAREVGGRGAAFDLCYVAGLNGAALVSLAELEQRPLAPVLKDAVRTHRQVIRTRLLRQQADWRAWRWRDARRLARDAALPAAAPIERRMCDGNLARPIAVPPVRPLTAPAKP
jgi:hypothetical protein